MSICGWLWLALAATKAAAAAPFEGKIDIVIARGGEVQTLLYTASTNQLRIERGETDRPHAKNIVNLDTGAVTLLFPHNRSFVRLNPGSTGSMPVASGSLPDATTKSLGAAVAPNPTGASAIPRMPPGIGKLPGLPMMPPPMMSEKIDLKPTGKREKILGFECEQFELKQRGKMMEIWATERLLPFQPYLRNELHRFGPRMIEEQWSELLKERKLFPLRASLRYDHGPSRTGDPSSSKDQSASQKPSGPERFRFEVNSIKRENIQDRDRKLFQPPVEYFEVQPLPF